METVVELTIVVTIALLRWAVCAYCVHGPGVVTNSPTAKRLGIRVLPRIGHANQFAANVPIEISCCGNCGSTLWISAAMSQYVRLQVPLNR